MLFRRVFRHVKDQNWTAVGIDFVIVVIGVFVGIQVSNWNEARVLRAQEATYLAQLRAEIAGNAEAIAHQTRFVQRVVAGGRSALAFLEGGEDCTEDCEALLVDVFHASQLWGTGYPQSKYDEVVRLGLPTDEAARRAVEGFYLNVDGWDVVNAAPPAYRERVRGHLSPEASEILWRGCYAIRGGRLEALPRVCADDLRALDVRAMLGRVRADAALAPQLRFWIGQNLSALQFHPGMRATADSAMAAIDRVLDS